MIAALLFAAMSRQGTVRTVELSRGALFQSSDTSTEPLGYWDTSDTYVDATTPDENFGGEPVLASGPSARILIRFGDLNRVLGATRKIRKATLFMTITGGDKPMLKSVDRVIVPWSAGPYFTVGALLKRAMAPKPTTVEQLREKPVPPRWSATWKQRLAGDSGASWQQGGANGPLDSETIKDAHATVGEKEVTIEELGPTFQYLADHPCDNYGLAIQFQNVCEFYSSRSAVGRPKLVLELEPEPKKSGPDLSVTTIERVTASGNAPKEGEDVTYRAHVKNVGDSKGAGYTAEWVLNGKPQTTTEVTDALAPGAESVLTTHKPFRLDKSDHRTQTVELRITPKGPDAVQGNNSLLVYDDARQIDVQIPESVAGKNSLNLIGSGAVEDWVQEQIRVFNDTYAAQSRYSFAPDGAKERVSVQHIFVGASAPTDGAHADGVAQIPESEKNWQSSDSTFFRSIGLAAGLPDFTSMSFPGGKGVLLKSGDKPVDRGTTDIFPGVIGYGDTRYEGVLAGPVGLLYEPYKAESSGLLPIIPTGLLSETDVAVLNARVEGLADPLPMPKTTLLKATDLFGRPLTNVPLDFFQSKNGEIPDGPPSFSITTSAEGGTAIIPTKPGLGPFGKLESNGSNGTYLIRATSHGSTEWGWLKAWQLIDTANRGNTIAGIIEVRFDLPTAPLDPSIDLAKDRIISDSTNLLPARIGALVSGTTDHEVTLGGKVGDWVEIDLGRDRTIGEITLLGNPGTFWSQFDILVYSTGQTASDAAPWANEINWNWTANNRRDRVDGDPNTISVAYRSPAVRIRFVRIVNRSSSIGKLKGIRVVPVKIAP